MDVPEHQDPREFYLRRREERQATVIARRSIERRLSWSRLFVFLAGLAMLWPVVSGAALPWQWLLLPAAAFVAVARAHERVIRRRVRVERAVEFYERGLARLDDRWAGTGRSGIRFADPQHPYAADLDLFGEGSLYELLCTARTEAGERTLAAWLSAPADPRIVRERQQAVDELRGRLDLREDLAVLAAEGASIDPDSLAAWGSSPSVLERRWPQLVAGLLGALNLYTLSLLLSWLLGRQTATGSWEAWLMPEGIAPFLIAIFAGTIFSLAFRARTAPVLAAVDRPGRELALLSRMLGRLERERFDSPRLVALRGALDGAGKPPSVCIARLAMLIELKEAHQNMIFGTLAALVLLPLQLAFVLERWRDDSGPSVARWIAALAEFEALSCFAGLAYENPSFPFPEVVCQGPCFDGEALEHPLIPEGRSVANDVKLGDGLQLMLISGSNMSGKSTLMRTVGVNTALALAGAPIRGKRLRLSCLAIGACMRVTDSLQQGLSHFYAEITRLKQLVDLGSERLPLLFLLDEILHGTNSHDRRLGAEALIRGLVERGALGMVTTHDLALARIADELEPRAVNVHFEDHIEAGKIIFDYRLRPGVVQKSNALELMRAVGLDV